MQSNSLSVPRSPLRDRPAGSDLAGEGPAWDALQAILHTEQRFFFWSDPTVGVDFLCLEGEEHQGAGSGLRELPVHGPRELLFGSFTPGWSETASTGRGWPGWPDLRRWTPGQVIWQGAAAAGRGARPAVTGSGVAGATSAQARVESAAPLPLVEESQADWCARVERLTAALAGPGPLHKVVMARARRRVPAAGQRFDVADTLRTLRRRDPSALCFAVRGPHGVFLGATPELLLVTRGSRLLTHALAGTARRHADPAIDRALGEALLESAKDRREHALVVEAIEAALGGAAQLVDRRPGPRLRRLARVQHLETPISADLAADADPLDVLRRLHPTPAIAGTPRPEALAWLDQNEPLVRGPYGGPVGWRDGAGNWRVGLSIRSALVHQNEAWLFAGAGIVASSSAEAEWRETELKLDTVGTALAERPQDPTRDGGPR